MVNRQDEEPESHNDKLEIINRLGRLTRIIYEGLRELGLDKNISRAVEVIPDTQQRLDYIAQMTFQAAEKTLNSLDQIKPKQEWLIQQAEQLTQRWDQWAQLSIELTETKSLVADTRQYLAQSQQVNSQINAQLLDIMMAQDFQDLTGQVIKKLSLIIQEIEQQLVSVLLENMTPDIANSLSSINRSNELLNGPQLTTDRKENYSQQTQVDELLTSLGL
ncbi:MAG TPA: protein phosphatase CheZ [Arsenophonus nasoniae]|uniref:protein phosphatase CheZ n=1 Tax=Arsenophonus nasoniae TaxID=638 RepID=UPI003878FE03